MSKIGELGKIGKIGEMGKLIKMGKIFLLSLLLKPKYRSSIQTLNLNPK
jgi:hypothetical protein